MSRLRHRGSYGYGTEPSLDPPDDGERTCPLCNESGTIPCPECEGKGCEECDFKKVQECPDCEGKGLLYGSQASPTEERNEPDFDDRGEDE
jgi:RecJ-like exonuclease